LLEDLSGGGPPILVTGGAGYVGAHTCKALRRSGYMPVVFDNFSAGHRSFVRWGPLVQGDLRDYAVLLDAFDFYKPRAVLHFAALSSVGDSVRDPAKYYDNNVAGSLSLLRAMLKTGCRKLVFSSSCAIYGEPRETPIRETARPDPVNPYGASKLMVERILADCGMANELQSIALRYFNASGADPDGEVGELHEVETRLIPRAFMAIQGQISDFTVYGTDYDTTDGTAIRDYVHVSDLAEAHVLALQRLLSGEAGGSFNLGTGRGYSVTQVLDAIASETGRRLAAAKGPRREGDPAVLIADAALAHAELSFAPSMSDLSSIIRTAWAWHRRARAGEDPIVL
jgi:UDP-glucose-4-epimerase GalE